MGMDKYGVDTETPKTADEQPKCPDCGKSVDNTTGTPLCPDHGSKPFEKKQD